MDWRKYLAVLAAQMLGSVSITLLKDLKAFAIKFREDARTTPNPWDDLMADFMCGILGIPEETE